jgi:hypothetical protein
MTFKTTACRGAAALFTAALLAGCTMPASNGKYAMKGHCERATGSLVCNPEPDGPETGNGISQPGVLTNLQGPPAGGH